MFLQWYAVLVTVIAMGIALRYRSALRRIKKNIATIESQGVTLREKEALHTNALENWGKTYRDTTVLAHILATAGPLEVQRFLAKAKTDMTRLGLRGLGTLPEPHGHLFRNQLEQQGVDIENRLREIMKEWRVTIP